MPKRTDKNQPKIVEQLRAIGCTVQHLHTVGQGCPDLLVGFVKKGVNGGKFNFLFEIKDPLQPPSKRKLTPDEKVFHESWRGQVDIIETFDDALKIINK